VFGKVKEGDEILDVIEKIPTGASDEPAMDLVILDVVVVEDPFAEYMARGERKGRVKVGRSEAREVKRDGERGAGGEIGKYLSGGKRATGGEKERVVKKVKKGGFGNFDGW
jgi:hypothetical protein